MCLHAYLQIEGLLAYVSHWVSVAQRMCRFGLNPSDRNSQTRGFRSHIGFSRRATGRECWQENSLPDVLSDGGF